MDKNDFSQMPWFTIVNAEFEIDPQNPQALHEDELSLYENDYLAAPFMVDACLTEDSDSGYAILCLSSGHSVLCAGASIFAFLCSGSYIRPVVELPAPCRLETKQFSFWHGTPLLPYEAGSPSHWYELLDAYTMKYTQRKYAPRMFSKDIRVEALEIKAEKVIFGARRLIDADAVRELIDITKPDKEMLRVAEDQLLRFLSTINQIHYTEATFERLQTVLAQITDSLSAMK